LELILVQKVFFNEILQRKIGILSPRFGNFARKLLQLIVITPFFFTQTVNLKNRVCEKQNVHFARVIRENVVNGLLSWNEQKSDVENELKALQIIYCLVNTRLFQQLLNVQITKSVLPVLRKPQRQFRDCLLKMFCRVRQFPRFFAIFPFEVFAVN
jgi:hypothetical protein